MKKVDYRKGCNNGMADGYVPFTWIYQSKSASGACAHLHQLWTDGEGSLVCARAGCVLLVLLCFNVSFSPAGLWTHLWSVARAAISKWVECLQSVCVCLTIAHEQL